jgi:hypothetical protein
MKHSMLAGTDQPAKKIEQKAPDKITHVFHENKIKIYFLGHLHFFANHYNIQSLHAYKYAQAHATTYHIDMIIDGNGEVPLSYTDKNDWLSVLGILNKYI